MDPQGIDPDEEVDIEIDQLSRSDRDLVAVGALFFWTIGYLTRATGRRELTLKIEFRRLPQVSPRAERAARELARAFLEANF